MISGPTTLILWQKKKISFIICCALMAEKAEIIIKNLSSPILWLTAIFITFEQISKFTFNHCERPIYTLSNASDLQNPRLSKFSFDFPCLAIGTDTLSVLYNVNKQENKLDNWLNNSHFRQILHVNEYHLLNPRPHTFL